MRRLVVVAGATFVVAGGLALLVATNLGGVVEAHRERLVAQVERVLGRPLSVASVRPSYWPVGIRLEGVSVAEGPGFGPEPFLESAGVVVAVRFWPLLRGDVEVAGVVLDRPRVRLVRDPSGRWNFASLGASARSERERSQDRQRARERTLQVPLEWVLGLALSEIRDGTIELRDRYGGDRSTTIRRVGLRAADVRLGGRPRVRVAAALSSAEGELDTWLDLRVSRLGGDDLKHTAVTARLDAERVDLSRVGALVGGDARVAGTITGVEATFEGTLERFTAAVEAHAEQGRWRIATRELDAPAMTFQAQIARDGNTLTLRDGGGSLGALRLSVRGTGQVRPWRADLLIRSEEGSGIALAPAATPPRLSGLDARVTIDPEGVRLAPARVEVDGAPVEIAGNVGGLAPLALRLRFAGQPLDGKLEGELVASPNDVLRLSARLDRIEIARAAERLAPDLGGAPSGRLSGSVDLGTRVAEGRWRFGPWSGSGTALLEDVRLRDVNVAELVLDRVQSLPLMPPLVSARERARYPEIFGSRDTAIGKATIPFSLIDGRLTSNGLTMVAGPYEISGSGWIERSRRTRFGGEVTLDSAVSRRLREDVPAVRFLADADGRVVLPFRLSGRLGEALPEPDVKRLRARGRRLLPDIGVGRAERPRGAEGDDRAGRPRAEGRDESTVEWLERMIRP